MDHDQQGGGSGAMVVDNIKQLENLPRMKYNSLQRKAFILNTVVPPQQATSSKLPDVVMNNDEIVLSPYAVSRSRDLIEGSVTYENDTNIFINHDYAQVKDAYRDSTLSQDSGTSLKGTVSYARTMPREADMESERYKGELPNSPEYAEVGQFLKKVKKSTSSSNQSLHSDNLDPSSAVTESPEVQNKEKGKQVDMQSKNSVVASKSSRPSTLDASTASHKSNELKSSSQEKKLTSEEPKKISEGTVMENDPLYTQNSIQSRLSHTSI